MQKMYKIQKVVLKRLLPGLVSQETDAVLLILKLLMGFDHLKGKYKGFSDIERILVTIVNVGKVEIRLKKRCL